MRLLRPATLTLLLGTTSSVCSAPYPVVTSMQTTITSPTSANYYVVYEVRDVPSAEQMVPPGWLVGSAHRHDAFPGGSDIAAMPTWSEMCRDVASCTTIAVPGDTMSSAAMRAFSSIGPSASGIVGHGGKGNGGECVGFIAIPRGNAPWSQAIYPPGSCVYAPPGREWCEFVTPGVVLDHGTISVGDTAPSQVTASVPVNCTAPMTIRLSLGSDVLALGKGVESRVSVPEAGGGGKVVLHAGDNPITLQSDLSLTGADAGTYSAATVLYIQYL